MKQSTSIAVLLPINLLFSVICFAQTQPMSIGQIDQYNQQLTDSVIRLKPEESLQTAERIRAAAREIGYKKGEAQALKHKTFSLLRNYQNDEGIQTANEGIQFVLKHQLEFDLAALYSNKSTMLARLGREEVFAALDSTLYYLHTSSGKKKQLVEYQVYYLKARCYDRVGKMKEATEAYLKAIQIAEINNFQSKLMDALFNLGFVHKALENWTKAIECFEQSLTIAQQTTDSTFIIYNHVFIAGSYMEEQKKYNLDELALPKALFNLKEALHFAAQQTTLNKPELELIYFEFSNYYQAKGEHKKAIEAIYKSRKYSESIQNTETLVANYTQAAECYFDAKNYSKAMQEIDAGITLGKQARTFYMLLELYELAAKVTEKQNELEKSYQFYKKYTTTKDSLFKEKTTAQLNELQAKYDTEVKDRKIKNLEQANRIEELEVASLEKQRTILTLSFLVPIVLVIGGGWYVNRRRLRLQLEAKEKEQAKQLSELKAIRSQMNPHFIFNALNSIQDFIMLSEKENAQLYLGKFAKLMRGFLEASSLEEISLANEIPLLKSYIELEGLRFDEEFSHTITFSKNLTEEELEDIYVPPLLIQPYLENAFKHGLFHKKGEKKLEMSFEKKMAKNQPLLQIKIIDNGIGREKATEIKAKKNSMHQSFATKATEERLELIKHQSNSKQLIEVKINDLINTRNQALGTEVVILITI